MEIFGILVVESRARRARGGEFVRFGGFIGWRRGCLLCV